ncbi:MAG: type II toxin-antitoxin system HicB family antitoxin [Chloroflexia bacterium]|nr:type II toxin-antitoxin system HicB family antitoxin [Chloroflexia bacterium]
MNIKVIVHEEGDGRLWAEVPSLPGCYTQGDTMEELHQNLRDVIQLFLTLDVDPAALDPDAKVLEFAV